MEARAGIEPAHKGFADLSLTTWVPRLGRAVFVEIAPHRLSQSGGRRGATWSGRRDLNSRPSPWQGDALPLSYSRLLQGRVYRAAETGSNRRAGSHRPCCGDRWLNAMVSRAILDMHNLSVAHMQDPACDGGSFRIVRNHQRRLPQLLV